MYCIFPHITYTPNFKGPGEITAYNNKILAESLCSRMRDTFTSYLRPAASAWTRTFTKHKMTHNCTQVPRLGCFDTVCSCSQWELSHGINAENFIYVRPGTFCHCCPVLILQQWNLHISQISLLSLRFHCSGTWTVQQCELFNLQTAKCTGEHVPIWKPMRKHMQCFTLERAVVNPKWNLEQDHSHLAQCLANTHQW